MITSTAAATFPLAKAGEEHRFMEVRRTIGSIVLISQYYSKKVDDFPFI
tara:strand:- start:464 stop:610 length:147 start_codon:yes stop_codon:yes gene_type:complete